MNAEGGSYKIRGNIIRSVPIVEVARKTKNAAQPATEKKFRRLMRQMPRSFSGGLSCFGFLVAGVAAFGVGVGASFGLAGDGEEPVVGCSIIAAGGGTPFGSDGVLAVSTLGSLGLSITLRTKMLTDTVQTGKNI